VPDDHDTDPLADTRESGEGESTSGAVVKVRAVRIGDVLGRYELVEEVGEGGMATVFRARDRELRRDVAVKVLFHHLARRPEVVRRFHREARAAASLEHANILKIFDVGGGEAESPPYIVMELIRGHSLLGEIEQKGPMLAELAACIGALLADALGAAHAAGIIHRDVKPANVLIANGGRVLLADFGVARLETEDSLVTKTGALLGTPAYMSPEQATGDTATARSDLYSLGAALYQLATGALPFTGSPAKVLAQLAQGGAVPAVKRHANVGPDLSRAIARMMQADANDRPGSAAEIASELRAIAAAGGLGDPGKELTEYFADRDKYLAAHTPAIVEAVVAAANRAMKDGKLPRALALADRAIALAPNDAKVAALVAAVTEGGRAAKRRRAFALAGAAVVAAGGATAGVMWLRGGEHAATSHDAAAIVAVTPEDAAVRATPDDAPFARDDAPFAREDAAPPGDARAMPLAVDAPRAIASRDAGRPGRVDAGALPIDAAPAVQLAADAGIVVADAPAAPASIIVKGDAWCNVSIDGVDHGRKSDAPIRIEPGHHTIVCEQAGTGKRWTQPFDIAPGQTKTIRGALLGMVKITFEVDASIDGVPYRRGQVTQLSAGQHRLIDRWITVTSPCTVRGPDLDCYP
jgi:serine/threonine-protein kinase